MFGFIKKCFLIVMTFFGCDALKCVLINNQECKIRPEIIIVNSNDFLFYPYSIEVSRSSASWNNINDPYAIYVFLILLKTPMLKYLI